MNTTTMSVKLNEKKLKARVLRAQGCARQQTKAGVIPFKYKLGHGGYYPKDSVPSRTAYCDCTGYGAWVFGMSRTPKATRDWWFETTNIWRNGMRRDNRDPVFLRLLEPVPGCCAVYPDRDGHEGHFVVITEVVRDGARIKALRGVDCSSGSSRKYGRAIMERDLTWIMGKNPGYFVLVEDQA